MVLTLTWIKPNSPYIGNWARSLQDRAFLYLHGMDKESVLPDLQPCSWYPGSWLRFLVGFGAVTQINGNESSYPADPCSSVSLLKKARTKPPRRQGAVRPDTVQDCLGEKPGNRRNRRCFRFFKAATRVQFSSRSRSFL